MQFKIGFEIMKSDKDDNDKHYVIYLLPSISISKEYDSFEYYIKANQLTKDCTKRRYISLYFLYFHVYIRFYWKKIIKGYWIKKRGK